MTEPDHSILAELARGASFSFRNAEDLYREATILYAHGAFSRALALHQIFMEECGKIEILGAWATSYLLGLDVDRRKVESALASHRAKNSANAYMLPVTEAEEKAREQADWKGAIKAFDEQKTAFHVQSNFRKNAALYVDFDGTTFVAPSDQITEPMVREISAMNSWFIEVVRPKVRMLGGWVDQPEGARAMGKYFLRHPPGACALLCASSSAPTPRQSDRQTRFSLRRRFPFGVLARRVATGHLFGIRSRTATCSARPTASSSFNVGFSRPISTRDGEATGAPCDPGDRKQRGAA
jgi:AbiV family abortive infection protein